MVKRGKLEIIRDILRIINENHNSIRSTPLLRKSNISTIRFKEYLNELINKKFIKESANHKGDRVYSLVEKGSNFLDRYNTIIEFIDEFGL